MNDLEIPLGKRTRTYRFFEIVPGLLSYGAIVLLIVLSFMSPLLAAGYLLLIILTVFVKSLGIALRTVQGYRQMIGAQQVSWHQRLTEITRAYHGEEVVSGERRGAWRLAHHKKMLSWMTTKPEGVIDPQEIYHAVIVAMYNETFSVLDPTLQSIADSDFPNSKLIIFLAYEERGGDITKETVARLEKKYKNTFHHFQPVMHPADMAGEVVGKGGNITFAGKVMSQWIQKKGIHENSVVITTLDSDNRPHPSYFAAVAYEFVLHPERHHLSFQPISLFLNNIWDVPAPMRVIATGNSFWNIISAMRPHSLRNFASHSQPLSALKAMNFWSVKTIVEDGHQYWRSYFFFKGEYGVLPIYVPIYQDAVLSDTYRKTLKAQFIQLRRWAYGASDVPYVAVRIFSRHSQVPFLSGVGHFFRLLDSHVTFACVPLLVAFGGWVPLFLNQEASRNIVAHELPEVISVIQRIAMVGIFISVFIAFKMLPPRPERYKRHRTVFMALQWLLMPITSIAYSSFAAFNAQTHLLTARYLEKFDVTEKAIKK
jgi:cellulose synthase/poly-beta-1,6-N-acetylglucosamine synthase-like glycosyltransferase